MLAAINAAIFALTLPSVSRREFLAAPLAAAVLGLPQAASAVSARTGQSSLFTGEYDDPGHPGCLRSVKVVGAKVGPDGRKERTPAAYVRGVDNAEGTKSCSGTPELASVWKLDGKVSEDGQSIFIDFSPKGGPKNLVGKYDDLGGDAGIVFPDGNKWTKVAGGTPSRRPPAVTLNSGDA